MKELEKNYNDLQQLLKNGAKLEVPENCTPFLGAKHRSYPNFQITKNYIGERKIVANKVKQRLKTKELLLESEISTSDVEIPSQDLHQRETRNSRGKEESLKTLSNDEGQNHSEYEKDNSSQAATRTQDMSTNTGNCFSVRTHDMSTNTTIKSLRDLREADTILRSLDMQMASLIELHNSSLRETAAKQVRKILYAMMLSNKKFLFF